MKEYHITLDGQTFAIRLLDDPQQERIRVEVNGEILTVEVKAAPSAGRAAAPEPAPVEPRPAIPETGVPTARVVAAPLPGVVKSIAIRSGDEVAVGDELLVIEAMKMNNVIRAPRAGIIERIHVTEGHRVAHGESMLEYGS